MESRIVKQGELYLLEVEGGKRMPLYGYMTYQPPKARYEDFKEAGVELFFCAVYAGDRGINQQSGIRPFMDGFWKGYEQYDFTPVEKVFRRVLDGCKVGEAYLIPRLMVEPPIWWEAENPDVEALRPEPHPHFRHHVGLPAGDLPAAAGDGEGQCLAHPAHGSAGPGSHHSLVQNVPTRKGE